MRDTKKLRRVLPIASSGAEAGGYGEYPFEKELSRAKKLPLNEKMINDSWSKLLGERRERKEPSKLYYSNGGWSLSEDVRAARETRDGIIWDNIPSPRTRPVADSELLEILNKSENSQNKIK